MGTVQMGSSTRDATIYTNYTNPNPIVRSGRFRKVLSLHCQVGSRSSLYAECVVAKESDARLLSLAVPVSIA